MKNSGGLRKNEKVENSKMVILRCKLHYFYKIYCQIMEILQSK